MKEVIMDFIVELDVKNLISDSFDWNKEVDNFLKSNDKAINYTRCCATLKDLKGNEIQIKSLSDLKKMYPEGTTFSVAGNGRELNYYVDGKVAYTRSL